MVYFFIFILLCIGIIAFLVYNKIYIHTSTMAVVMALGIITQGVLLNFFGKHFFHGVFGKILTVIDLSLWSSFSVSFLMSFFNKKFSEIHYFRPINRFGIGTWVAGTSICGILIFKQFHEWVLLSIGISYFNFGLWIAYIALCIKAFYDIHGKRLTKNVHGILLLTTVSTQSIVLLISTVFKHIPMFIDVLLITLGIVFYILSSFFIIKRYCSKTDLGSLETEWNNTNCILHGALSITGLASLVSHAADRQEAIIIWFCAAITFFVVECLEGYRLVKRIKAFGLKKGVFIYDVSQWSRVFTFGMFYTFTYINQSNDLYYSLIRKLVILLGIWVILFLVVIEILLFLNHAVQTYKNTHKIQKSTTTSVNSSF